MEIFLGKGLTVYKKAELVSIELLKSGEYASIPDLEIKT